MNVTLASLSRQTGLAVLDHLEQSVTIPVVDGPQAQGDLIVIPLSVVARNTERRAAPRARTWSAASASRRAAEPASSRTDALQLGRRFRRRPSCRYPNCAFLMNRAMTARLQPHGSPSGYRAAQTPR
jgi:hypothetical protein